MSENDEGELRPRTPAEVARRVLALLAVSSIAHHRADGNIQRWVAEHKIEGCFSPVEARFFRNPTPSQQDIIDHSWRAEALVPLMWALGMIDEFPALNAQFDLASVPNLSAVFEDPDAFVLKSSLRSEDEAENNLYHQHWRVRDAQLFGKPMPPELNPGIVQERRYGASWLAGWGDDWDEVPTDT